jgi:hypothetical protein
MGIKGKLMMITIYARAICVCLWLLASCCTYASQISTSDTRVKLIELDAADSLVPATANAQQNSYTVMDSFRLDRPLKIINTADAHGGAAAKLIVIKADFIELKSSIELIGEVADLLIISSNPNYSFTCNACSFTNFGRVTLAQAVPALDANNLPGLLTLLPYGSLLINGLTTQQVASLEVIAQNISIDGNINTQLKGSYTDGGGYTLNPNGSLIIGAGGINVFAGFNMNYPDLAIQRIFNNINTYKLPRQLPSSDATLSIPATATITTQSVHIATAASVVVDGSINTQSDVISTANYRGKLAAIDEAIEIYSFSPFVRITINGALRTDNRVDIRGSYDVFSNGVIAAKTFNVTTAAKLTQRGEAEFFEANLAASEFENNGKLMGRVLKVATKGALQNRFGGKLLADTIELSSQAGVIRNGSQYPFKTQDDMPVILKPDSATNIHFGTINGIPFSGAAKVNDLSAAILGKNITLAAGNNVENINPYFEYTLDTAQWANGVVFDEVRAAQVQLVAENTLFIASGTYVLNSSAIMGVNNKYGEFRVSAPYVTNERYNTKVVVQPIAGGTESALMVYSPPGMIYSFAPLGFYFTQSYGGFINNTAYFEVLNSATFTSSPNGETEASRVTSIGLQLQKNLDGGTFTDNRSINDCIAQSTDKSLSGTMSCVYNPGVTKYIAGSKTIDMQGTLFSVLGDIKGATTEFYGTNHVAINDAKRDAINDFIAANTGSTRKETITDVTYSYSRSCDSYGQNCTVTGSSHGETYTWDFTRSAALSVDGTTITVTDNGVRTRADGTETTKDIVVKTVTVSEWITKAFADIKAALVKLLQDFDNWLKN